MVREVANWLDDACDFCHRARPIVLLFLYITILCLSGYGMYSLRMWWTDDAPAVEFGQGDVTPLAARPGEVLIHRVVTGDCGHLVISEKKSTLPAGFSGRLTIPVQLPQEAIPGSCGFRVHARYFCNPFDWVLQRQVFVSPVIPFEVKGYEQ
jgi:hypothetical protein